MRGITSFLATLALVLGAIFTVVTHQPTTGVQVETAAATFSGYEDRVQYWINHKRVNHGRVPLRFHSCTDKYAERWARHLAETHTFQHRPSLDPFFSDCGVIWVGEIMARGDITPRRAVNLWMLSDAHREVLLRYKARRLGVGVARDGERLVVVANLTRLG